MKVLRSSLSMSPAAFACSTTCSRISTLAALPRVPSRSRASVVRASAITTGRSSRPASSSACAASVGGLVVAALLGVGAGVQGEHLGPHPVVGVLVEDRHRLGGDRQRVALGVGEHRGRGQDVEQPQPGHRRRAGGQGPQLVAGQRDRAVGLARRRSRPRRRAR